MHVIEEDAVSCDGSDVEPLRLVVAILYTCNLWLLNLWSSAMETVRLHRFTVGYGWINIHNVLQSDPDLVTPDLVTPRFSDMINFPRYKKLMAFDPDLVTPRFSDRKIFPPRMSLNRCPTVVMRPGCVRAMERIYLQQTSCCWMIPDTSCRAFSIWWGSPCIRRGFSGAVA